AQIKKGDHCCLYHYEVGTLFALWQAASDGARNISPKAWGGRFPFQVKVALATHEILEIPKASVPEAFINADTGKFDNIVVGPRAEQLIQFVQTFAAKPPN